MCTYMYIMYLENLAWFVCTFIYVGGGCIGEKTENPNSKQERRIVALLVRATLTFRNVKGLFATKAPTMIV